MPFLPEQTPGPPSSGERPSFLMRHTMLHPLHADQDLLRVPELVQLGQVCGRCLRRESGRSSATTSARILFPAHGTTSRMRPQKTDVQRWQAGYCQLHTIKKGSCKCKTTGFEIWGIPASLVTSSRIVLGTVPNAFLVRLDCKSVRVETLL